MMWILTLPFKSHHRKGGFGVDVGEGGWWGDRGWWCVCVGGGGWVGCRRGEGEAREATLSMFRMAFSFKINFFYVRDVIYGLE